MKKIKVCCANVNKVSQPTPLRSWRRFSLRIRDTSCESVNALQKVVGFFGYSGFLPQGMMTEWVLMNHKLNVFLET